MNEKKLDTPTTNFIEFMKLSNIQMTNHIGTPMLTFTGSCRQLDSYNQEDILNYMTHLKNEIKED
jgi:hypothetical protein